MAWLARFILTVLSVVAYFWALGFVWGIGLLVVYWLATVAKKE